MPPKNKPKNDTGKMTWRKRLQALKYIPPFIKLVWELDRLGRSMRDFVNLISKFQDLGVGFKSLQDNIDTTTPTGKLTLHLFAALAEFERDIIFERTKAGLESEPEEEAADDQKDYPKKLWIKLVCQKAFSMKKIIQSKKYASI